MDRTCPNPQCQEPWDAYGITHGDMSPEEADLFNQGKGCVHCHFGYSATPLADAIALARVRPTRLPVDLSSTPEKQEAFNRFLASSLDATDEPDEILAEMGL